MRRLKVRRSVRLAAAKTPDESARSGEKKLIKPISKRSRRRGTVFRDAEETPSPTQDKDDESDPGTTILPGNTGTSHEESDGIASSDGDKLESSARRE